jgi:molecular chaperone GrpE
MALSGGDSMIINRCNIRALASDAEQGGDAPMSGSGQDSEVTENAEKSGATVGEPGGDAATLQAALAEVTQKFNETNDRMYRIAADFENSRKRWEKEKSDLKSYCISEFARDLLPVIDSFDKAMTAIEQLTLNVDTEEGKQVASIVEGVQLVSKVFADTLKKHGVEKLPGKGEAFNPNFHNAIAKTVDTTLQQEMVVDEFLAGYRIGERILRTAMVRVASPD